MRRKPVGSVPVSHMLAALHHVALVPLLVEKLNTLTLPPDPAAGQAVVAWMRVEGCGCWASSAGSWPLAC